MVTQTKSTKKAAIKTTVKKPVKKTRAKSATKQTIKSTKVAYYPNLVTFLISTAAVMILFSLALLVTM